MSAVAEVAGWLAEAIAGEARRLAGQLHARLEGRHVVALDGWEPPLDDPDEAARWAAVPDAVGWGACHGRPAAARPDASPGPAEVLHDAYTGGHATAEHPTPPTGAGHTRPPELDTLAAFLDLEAARYRHDLDLGYSDAQAAADALEHAASLARRWPDA